MARSSGITDMDTAQSYGDSESVLGEVGIEDWNIYTKLTEIPGEILSDGDDVRKWVTLRVRESLSELRLETLTGLMLHQPSQLLVKGGGALYEALVEQRERGLVKSIGISVYGPKELNSMPASMTFDFVQGPLNVLDMRLARSGWLSRLAGMGCTFFARSVFLQGLLLMPSSERPQKFDRWSEVWRIWEEYLRETGITAVQACLRHSVRVPNVDKIIVGITSSAQLSEVVNSLDGDLPLLPDDLAMEDDRLLEPTNWRYL